MGNPIQRLDDSIDEIWNQKIEYEKKSGEQASVDDIVSAAIKTADEEELMKEVRRRKKKKNKKKSKKKASEFDQLFSL